MSEKKIEQVELSSEELDTVAGGRIDSVRAAFVKTNFEAVGSGAAATPGLATSDGLAINDETDQAAISLDRVD